MITPHDSCGYSSTAWLWIASRSSVVRITGPYRTPPASAGMIATSSPSLSEVRQTVEPVDRLAVDVDGHVLVDLAPLVAHEPLQSAVGPLELVEEPADVRRAHVDAVAIAVARRKGVGIYTVTAICSP